MNEHGTKERRRLTELFPGLLPVRRWQRKQLFYLKMRFDGAKYAGTRAEAPLPYLLFGDEWPQLNPHTGYGMACQLNKAYNISLATPFFDGLLIRPGETFSFYHTLHGAGRLPYRDGLEVVNGVMTLSHGGGLCQLSSMLFWLFLHSPLTVMERHGHRSGESALPGSCVPPGADAAVSEGWLDLKTRNDTANVFQLCVSTDGDKLAASLRTEKPFKDVCGIYRGLPHGAGHGTPGRNDGGNGENGGRG